MAVFVFPKMHERTHPPPRRIPRNLHFAVYSCSLACWESVWYGQVCSSSEVLQGYNAQLRVQIRRISRRPKHTEPATSGRGGSSSTSTNMYHVNWTDGQDAVALVLMRFSTSTPSIHTVLHVHIKVHLHKTKANVEAKISSPPLNPSKARCKYWKCFYKFESLKFSFDRYPHFVW